MKLDRRAFLTASLISVGLTLSTCAISVNLASCEKSETPATSPESTFSIDITNYSELGYFG